MALKSLGVSIAMDDFGTGYSSLATCAFPFDKIKVDRSFIRASPATPHSAAIVEATLLLGKSLRIPVLAEGVETEAHLAFLRDEDCPSVQGYLFGQPMPIAEVERMIAQAGMAQTADAVPACADAPALAPGQAMLAAAATRAASAPPRSGKADFSS